MSNKYQRQYLKSFLSYSQIKLPFLLIKLPKTLPWIMLLIIMFLSLAPWIQTSKGFGYVISRNPTLNSQNIESLVSGRIAKWYVKEGQLVRKGDKILEISDNDPLLIARIKAENAAKRNKLANARLISETSKINYLRQEKLYLQGISSKLSFEEAKINYQKNHKKR
jgi:multidrug efflux pump subunit AcrA (membrane-fusion protein)